MMSSARIEFRADICLPLPVAVPIQSRHHLPASVRPVRSGVTPCCKTRTCRQSAVRHENRSL